MAASRPQRLRTNGLTNLGLSKGKLAMKTKQPISPTWPDDDDNMLVVDPGLVFLLSLAIPAAGLFLIGVGVGLLF